MNPLESVRAEIAALAAKLDVLRQTEKLLETVYAASAPVFNIDIEMAEDNLSDMGITRAIDEVLSSSPNTPFAPTAVRDALVARKFQLVGENPMASVHQILKRLAKKQDSPVTAREVNGQTVYICEVLPSAPGSHVRAVRSRGEVQYDGVPGIPAGLLKRK
jgi:hypothetical protein